MRGAPQLLAVALRTGDDLLRVRDEGFPARDTAGWHIRDEARSRVIQPAPFGIYRNLDDPVSERLKLLRLAVDPQPALDNYRLGHHVGLNDLHPRTLPEPAEIRQRRI